MTMPGIESGSSTSRNTCQREAPRSKAASRVSCGTMLIPSVIGNSMKGKWT